MFRTSDLRYKESFFTTVPPTFEEPLKDEKLLLKSTLTMSVKAKGFPKPSLQWLKNGNIITKSKRCTIVEDGPKSTIKITAVTVDDSDTYSVTAKNCVGEATTTCIVAAQGRIDWNCL